LAYGLLSVLSALVVRLPCSSTFEGMVNSYFFDCIELWTWVMVTVTTPATPLLTSVVMRTPAGYFFGGLGDDIR
jgi:hypothetical protein